MLRDYQQRAIDQLYAWFSANPTGNPCLVLPTGSGKSHIVAALCKNALQEWPETTILMLTHVKELIVQNAEKMRLHWPGAPLGIYSAGIGKKDLGEPITFAGIQSVRTKAPLLGHIDLVIIDECFVSGTKISTTKGQIDIDKVRCGDLVFNTRGIGIVEAVSCRSVLETFLVELDDGSKFECTGNHPIFTENGWKKTSELEVGTHLFCIEDVSSLWSRIQTLDQKKQQWQSNFSNAGECVDQAELLLREVCKEIKPDGDDCGNTETDKRNSQKNQASTYSAWRKRAIAAFASVSVTSRIGRGMDSGICNKNQSGTFERDISKCVQSGHLQSRENDLHRIGRGKPQQHRKENARQQKRPISCGPRVARISRVKRESPVLVFNLQVSGHPSYFANGVAVHNCHLVSHKDEGGYRNLLNDLQAINPHLRVVGLSATPYRLGHGLITVKPALFDALIEPVSIEELVHKKFLATLRSKLTTERLDVSGVHKRGGEYIEAELQAAVDNADKNVAVVREVIKLAQTRKAWLFFCAGVKHAQHVCQELINQGVTAACVTGDTSKPERNRILTEFKAGRIRALTNANVLTTGFDYPDIDLIAMLRPTMSASLYVQMAGRGMRPKSHTDHCLVLDFAGVVEMHGPITNVQPPRKGGSGEGEAPVKVCDVCHEIVHISAHTCPMCGTPFPPAPEKKLVLRHDDIMGLDGVDMPVSEWHWRKHVSRASGNEMIALTYYGGLTDPPITEYLPVLNQGYAGTKAIQLLHDIARRSDATLSGIDQAQVPLTYLVTQMNASNSPTMISYKRDGKFYKVVKRLW